jgi:hypothetical protein
MTLFLMGLAVGLIVGTVFGGAMVLRVAKDVTLPW